MSAHGWPEAFLRVLPPEQILDPHYLFSVFSNGSVYCKACGRPIAENREDHLEFHRTELETLLEERRVSTAEKRQEALRAARSAKVQHTVIKSDLGAVSDVILGEHGPDCECPECQEAF